MQLTNDNKIQFTGEYITLGQVLKFFRLVSTGGEEKYFLATHDVKVNSEKEIRRGRKLRNGDNVSIDGKAYTICVSGV